MTWSGYHFKKTAVRMPQEEQKRACLPFHICIINYGIGYGHDAAWYHVVRGTEWCDLVLAAHVVVTMPSAQPTHSKLSIVVATPLLVGFERLVVPFGEPEGFHLLEHLLLVLDFEDGRIPDETVCVCVCVKD